jgi:hypothetical protein
MFRNGIIAVENPYTRRASLTPSISFTQNSGVYECRSSGMHTARRREPIAKFHDVRPEELSSLRIMYARRAGQRSCVSCMLTRLRDLT